MNRSLFLVALGATAVASTLPVPALPKSVIVGAATSVEPVVAYTGAHRLYELGSADAWVRATSPAEALETARRYADEIYCQCEFANDTPVREIPPAETFGMQWEDGLPDGLKHLAPPCECSPEDLAKFGCECDAASDMTLHLTAAEWVDTKEFIGTPVVGQADW